MKIYFLLFHVKPLPDLGNSDDIAGAYVSCWIKATSINKASREAIEKIKALKWVIVEEEEAYEIKEDNYSVNYTGIEYYKQALIDKWVVRFHTYPKQ